MVKPKFKHVGDGEGFHCLKFYESNAYTSVYLYFLSFNGVGELTI